MRIAILEDDEQEKEQLLNALHAWDPSRSAEWYTTVNELIFDAKKEPYFTVVFLDIYLPKENGLDAVERLRKVSPKTEIVFLTSSQEHAIAAFSLKALHYIVKPVKVEDICEVFDRIREKHAYQPAIELKAGKEKRMVFLQDIAYISADNHSVIVFKKDNTSFSCYMKLSDIQEKLTNDFLKIQRGLIVNCDYIESMQKDACKLKNGDSILLSRNQRKEIYNAYNEYIFRHLSQREAKLI